MRPQDRLRYRAPTIMEKALRDRSLLISYDARQRAINCQCNFSQVRPFGRSGGGGESMSWSDSSPQQLASRDFESGLDGGSRPRWLEEANSLGPSMRLTGGATPAIDGVLVSRGVITSRGVDYTVSGQERASAQLGPPMMQGPPVPPPSGHILAF